MKLISLYIENFGGLSRYQLEFEAGITSVAEPNGFGKTTLAEFIRAMFYGFPRKSKTLEKSRRQKYAPWNGGQYGGNLVFSHQGRRYRVERWFGTNPRGDTFELIDLETGRKSTRFGEELGLELFGLDADSFERSTYLPQSEPDEMSTTASIVSKLSDLVENGTEAGNYDKAIALLRAERSALVPYRGSGGAVAETAQYITQLQLQLDTAYSCQEQLRAAQEEAALAQADAQRAQKQLAVIREGYQLAARQETDRQHQLQYAELCRRRNVIQEKISFYRKKYPLGLPQEEALLSAELAAVHVKQDGEIAAAERIPTAEQLEHCRSICAQFAAQQERAGHLQRRIMEIMQAETVYPDARSGFPAVAAAAMLCGGVMIVAGAALVLLLEWIYGLAVFAAGVLAILCAIVLLCVRRRKHRLAQRERNMHQQQIRSTLSDLRAQADQANRMAAKSAEEACGFFAQFDMEPVPSQYPAALLELEQRLLRSTRYRAELAQSEQTLRLFFDSLGIEPERNVSALLQQLREDMHDLRTANILSGELAEQIAAMEASCGGILTGDSAAAVDIQDLQHQEQQLRDTIAAATTRMLRAQQRTQHLQEQVLVIPQLLAELENKQKKQAEDREKVQILDATMAYLMQARENLAKAYMGAIRSRFGHYLSMLQEDNGESYLIDTELRIRLERNGSARELAYFSAGQTDLVLLCMRLALVDALFGDREMFLVLDDPFINLDDAHMEKARKLLRKLSGNHQILYLTCHSSRTV